MNKQTLIEIINRKRERQSLLKIREKSIEEIDFNLNVSSLKKSILNIGNRFTAFVLLLLSIVIISCSIAFIASPKLLSDNLTFIDTPQQKASRKIFEYKESVQLSEEQTKRLEVKMQNDIESMNNIIIRSCSLFFLVFTSFLILKRKHLLKIRERNKQFLHINLLTQSIIADYKSFIKEEEKELNEFENLLKTAGK